MSHARIAIMTFSLLLSSSAHAQMGSALGDAAKQLGGAAQGAAGSAAGTVAAPAAAPSGSLTDLLVQQLGVTETQATGGAGAIFGLAKSKMSAGDFGKIAAGVPNMDALLAAAPATGATVAATGGTAVATGGLAGATGGLAGATGGLGAATGAVGGATGGLAGATGSLGSLAGLAGSFSSLGMSGDMVTKFAPVCVQYLQGSAGPEAAGLLQAALQ
jgi:hypothetical protein